MLSVVAMWNVRWTRWSTFALATLICVSTITTGWHYLIDVIGGLAVTFLAQALANLVLESVPSAIVSDVAREEAEITPV